MKGKSNMELEILKYIKNILSDIQYSSLPEHAPLRDENYYSGKRDGLLLIEWFIEKNLNDMSRYLLEYQDKPDADEPY